MAGLWHAPQPAVFDLARSKARAEDGIKFFQMNHNKTFKSGKILPGQVDILT